MEFRETLIRSYDSRIRYLLLLYATMTPNTLVSYTIEVLLAQLIDELCELDFESRVLNRQEEDPRSVISLF